MSNKKKFFFIFLFILLDAFLLVGYLVIRDKVALADLKAEMKVLEKLDVTSDRYNKKMKTTGDYAKVEKTIKKYLDDYAVDVQDILSTMKDSKLTKILSYENYEKDAYEFTESFKYLDEEKTSLNDKINSLQERSKKESIEKYIDKKIKDKSYRKTCKELMLTDSILNELDETSKSLDTIKTKVNKVIDTSKEVLQLIKDNKDNCVLEEEQIKFKSKPVYDKYNELINKIKED